MSDAPAGRNASADAKFAPWIARWQLEPHGAPIQTATGALLPVLRGTKPAMLKLFLDEEEKTGATLLGWWAGDGAAFVIEADDGALLMERAAGRRSLTEMSAAGRDDAATDILCAVAAALHRKRPHPPPDNLIPLETRFRALFARASDFGGILPACAGHARNLLQSQTDIRPLHGDLHHDNVLDFGDRGFLAIDPKGLTGERAFDLANIFCNPDLADPALRIARDPVTFEHRLRRIARQARLEPERLLRWIAAWGGLSATWFIQDDDPRADIPLEIAELALARIEDPPAP
ncbi:APH(6) family putative aminoglycoside O-phosphotransferase [Martelella lutilitoris]|uniref:APH(6) family putative aminoglycoside O-phosphotransferase n=1 Tax=Martelella lutilitoris TaxID=2583532 RepID=A0A7T7HH73_9HYPH|nr:aminoglycoside phosphotransferase family protein [Martelella lutilitoris]QQM29126.1 APH(6) family putative aminoglycoside O-phosphotransferase [Martelella lutilitoris]